MDPGTQESLFANSAALAGAYRNFCMFLAMLGAVRIMWLGARRYKTEPAWQWVMLGGLLLAAGYVAIVSFSGGLTGDSFFTVVRSYEASTNDFLYLLKGGLLLAVIGAFSVSRNLGP